MASFLGGHLDGREPVRDVAGESVPHYLYDHVKKLMALRHEVRGLRQREEMLRAEIQKLRQILDHFLLDGSATRAEYDAAAARAPELKDQIHMLAREREKVRVLVKEYVEDLVRQLEE